MYKFEKKGKKNICLMGLMGSGKSIIGRKLANDMEFSFFDIDEEIVNSTKKSINAIFKENGEDYFRKLEEEVCLKYLDFKESIISLGGGSILSSKVRKMMKLHSYSIYLKVEISILNDRLKSSKKRPLLKNEKIINKLEAIYEVRKKFYEDANFIVDNNGDHKKTINDIKLKILN